MCRRKLFSNLFFDYNFLSNAWLIITLLIHQIRLLPVLSIIVLWSLYSYLVKLIFNLPKKKDHRIKVEPRSATDPDSNPSQTRIWPSLSNVEACAETYILGITKWFRVISTSTCKSKRWRLAIYYQTLTPVSFICRCSFVHKLGGTPTGWLV